MKILIADKFEAFGIAELKKIADEVVCEPELKGETLTQRVAGLDPTILIVRVQQGQRGHAQGRQTAQGRHSGGVGVRHHRRARRQGTRDQGRRTARA